MKPAISVVVPAFNEEKYLDKCLTALKAQTFKNYEIIVVDNNSSDNTAKIAKKFGVRVVTEQVQGMIPARERGFKEAKAEVIARTDADTIVPPDWLSVIYETFEEHPDAVALLGMLKAPNDKLPDEFFEITTKLFFVQLGKLLTGHPFLIGPNMALRKSAWQQITVHTDDSQVHEDIDLACQLAKVGEILFVPEMSVPLSLRRFKENPVKGMDQYLREYPVRYIKTILINNPRFIVLKERTLANLSKIRKTT